MKIITETAPPVTQLRKSVPPNVAAALTKALEKLPADRFASAKEFAEALTNPSFTAMATARQNTPVPVELSGSRRMVPWVVGALLAAVAAWGWLRTPPEPTLHLTIPPLAGTSFLPNPRWPALSPDGRIVVFAAVDGDGMSRLYRRPIDGFRTEAIEGSEEATYPFFSPDGEWIGFFTRSRELRKVPLEGGRAVTITEIPFWRSGAVWRRDGTIAVVSDARGIYSVPDHGGSLAPLGAADSANGVSRLDFPHELRDGRLLATRARRAAAFDREGDLVVVAPGENEWRLVSSDAWGVYVEPGFLISQREGGVSATRFNLDNGRTEGRPMLVLEGAGPRSSDLTVNQRGDVAWFAFPGAEPRFLVMVDRTGRARRLPVPAGNHRHPRLSPDGTRLATNLSDDLWVLDLRSNAWTRLTTGEVITEPQWAPDNLRLAHTVFDTSTGYNPPALRNANGSGTAQILHNDFGDAWTSDWSRDGRRLAIYGGKGGMNVAVVDLDSARTVHAVTSGNSVARNARFSPDGRWLAYQSNETGRMQVYVVSYPDLEQKRPISTEGGTEPAWRPNGGELYYRNGPSMMVASIRTSPTLEVGTPRELFRGPFLEDIFGDRSYDVMPDGEQFLMFESNPAAAPELRVIRGWAAELKATVGKR